MGTWIIAGHVKCQPKYLLKSSSLQFTHFFPSPFLQRCKPTLSWRIASSTGSPACCGRQPRGCEPRPRARTFHAIRRRISLRISESAINGQFLRFAGNGEEKGSATGSFAIRPFDSIASLWKPRHFSNASRAILWSTSVSQHSMEGS